MISLDLIVKTGPYTNEDAISRTINYICRFNNDNIFFYGNWPPTKESAIGFFESLRSSDSHVTSPQKVQHFIIPFGNCKDTTFINTIANNIALLFAPAFPICFALHDNTDYMHVHFILSTTSVFPNHPPLVKGYWEKATQYLKDFARDNMNINLNIKYKP